MRCSLARWANAGAALARAAAAVVCVALLSACGPKLELPPATLAETRAIDPEVLALVQRKVDSVAGAPGDARAHASLGLVYTANGLWDAAQRSFSNAERLDPANPWWRFHHAHALREAGETERAFAMLEGVVRELPNEACVLQRWAQAKLELGDNSAARSGFERALALLPEHPDLLAGLAAVDVAEERWPSALDQSQRALRKDPSAKFARYQAGMALRGLGRAAEAERELAQGLGARPRWIENPATPELVQYRVSYVSQVEDATTLMLQGRHALALPILERVHAKRPDDVEVMGNIAACLQETGQAAKAVEILQRALVIAPDAFATHLNLADAYLRLNRPEDADGHAKRACELAPELGRAHLMRGRVLSVRGQYDLAYPALRESLRLDANNPIVYVALFETSARLGRQDEALAWCRRAVEVDPTYFPARVNLAYMLLKTKDLAGARAVIGELERLAPTHERVQALRSELEALGR